MIAFPLAAGLHELPWQFWQILYTVVFPMLLLAAIGFLVQRKLGLDPATLTRVNFYFVVPGTIFYALVGSQLTASAILAPVGITLLVMSAMAGITLVAAAIRRVPRGQVNAMIASTIFYNSGNYGLPLQKLAFREHPALAQEAVSCQAFVMIVQNVTNFTIGVLLAAAHRTDRHWRHNLLAIAKFPPLYALSAAIITVLVRWTLGPADAAIASKAFGPFWDVAGFLYAAFPAVALFTLGAQLALVKPATTRYPVKTSVMLRLLVGPALGLLFVWLTGVRGLVAQQVVISTSTPTAINAMLICMEFENHPDYMARAVFYSTVLSPITITLVVFLTQSGLVPWLAIPGVSF